jgi:hypothetical protein
MLPEGKPGIGRQRRNQGGNSGHVQDSRLEQKAHVLNSLNIPLKINQNGAVKGKNSRSGNYFFE